LHKLARRALLDDARQKVALLSDHQGTRTWQSLVQSTGTKQRLRTTVDSILDAARLTPSLSTQRAKFVDLLVDSNTTRKDGNKAAHEMWWADTKEAVMAYEGEEELKDLLKEVFQWVYPNQ
jgi:hypothetical protein